MPKVAAKDAATLAEVFSAFALFWDRQGNRDFATACLEIAMNLQRDAVSEAKDWRAVTGRDRA